MAKYVIVRHFQSDDHENRIVKRGLTKEAAMAHCNDPETSSSTAKGRRAAAITAQYGEWFDGWTEQ